MMTTLIGGLNLKLSQILYGNNFDVHGHEITFEKTGDFEYSLYTPSTVTGSLLLICPLLS